MCSASTRCGMAILGRDRSSRNWTAAVELPALVLLFWLMRRMSAVRMTTRFVVTPLIVNMVGPIVLRPSMRRAGRTRASF